MLFDYSLHSRGTARPIATLKLLITCSLLTYILGAFLRALGPGEPWDDIGGSLLVLASIILASLVISSSVARVAGEKEDELDEYERALNHSTLASAYRKLGIFILALVVYADFAPKFGVWVPQSNQWVGILFFVLLVWLLLPTALLLRRMPAEDIRAEAEGQA